MTIVRRAAPNRNPRGEPRSSFEALPGSSNLGSGFASPLLQLAPFTWSRSRVKLRIIFPAAINQGFTKTLRKCSWRECSYDRILALCAKEVYLRSIP
jgi:hypothetical protein